MLPLLFFVLIAVPLVELYVIVQVAHHIGALDTIALLIVESIVGAWLLKRQGMSTWRALQEALARGEMPTQHLADGAMILLGGALLLTPGFVTDIFGYLLLAPPVRSVLRKGFRRLLGRWAKKRFGGGGVYTATATGVRSRPSSSARPAGDDRRLPGRESDSPDRG